MSKKPPPSQSTTLARRTSLAFALLMFVVVPLFIYRPAIDASLVPKFLLLAGLLLVFLPVLHFQLRKKLPLEHIIRQTPVLIWMAFIGLSVLSLVVAYNPWVGLFDILRAGILLCFLLILMLYLELDLPLRSLRLAIIALGWIQAVIGLYQYSVHVFGETDLQQLYLINGLMTHKNIF
ncbi:MAG: hypothetical protein IH599_07885, partial [Bacteroidales bacterium]|nr:hypothetical protein [Bacteroidales bacterium]